MSLVSFISKRLSQNKNLASSNKVHIIVQIAVGSIAVSVIAMILSVFIVRGFQEEIRNKVILFDGHLKIGKFDLYQNISGEPISKNQTFVSVFSKNKEIAYIHPFIEKAALVKTKTDVHGVIVKGVDGMYDTSRMSTQLIEGQFFNVHDSSQKNHIVIGSSLARNLHLGIGDKVRFYFMQDPVRVRMFTISGIFKTGMDQMDDFVVFCPMKHLQVLQDWNSDQVAGFEIFLRRFEEVDRVNEYIYQNIGYELNTIKIEDKYPEIFAWLHLLDTNVWVVLIFAVLVSMVNMISTLLIIILDKTNTVGLLKVFGATDRMVLRIFFSLFARFVFKGMLIGNVIAIGFSILQDQFHLITLPEETYYIEFIPIRFEWMALLGINGLTILCCFIAYIIPSFIIARIQPAQTVKFNG